MFTSKMGRCVDTELTNVFAANELELSMEKMFLLKTDKSCNSNENDERTFPGLLCNIAIVDSFTKKLDWPLLSYCYGRAYKFEMW